MNTSRPTRLGRARGIAAGLIAAALAGASAGPVPRAAIAAASGASAQPHPVPFCETASPDCVAAAVERLRALRDRLGCDHRAVFASAYTDLTQTLLDTLRRDPHFFQDPVWLTYLDVRFVNVYIDQEQDDDAGRPVSEAWRIAFDTARRGDVYAGQDLLLGLNAHVQNDLPFVEAEMGLTTPSGATRRPDHLRFNDLFDGAYARVVQSVTRRYDPLVGVSNPGLAYDTGAARVLFQRWREEAWRNAERLTDARTPAERDRVAASIAAHAAASARSIAAAQEPGHRPRRDAYCRSHAPGG